jgi:hypothetical protein
VFFYDPVYLKKKQDLKILIVVNINIKEYVSSYHRAIFLYLRDTIDGIDTE